MRKLITLIFVITSFVGISQNAIYNGWGQRGNTVGTHSASIGTLDNRGMLLVFNNTIWGKVDSIGRLNIGAGSYSYNPGAQMSVLNATGAAVSGVQTRTASSFSELFLGANTATSSTGIFHEGSGVTPSGLYLANSGQIQTFSESFLIDNAMSTGSIVLAIASTEALRITRNRNVGINNTNPTATLQVGGTFSASSTGTINGFKTIKNGAGGLFVESTTNSSYSGIDFNTDLGASQGQFLFTGSTFANSGFGSSQAIFANYITAGGVVLAAGGGSGFIRFMTGGIASGNNRMHISLNGNVGIGTESGTATLTTIGTTSASSTSSLNGLQLVSGGYSVTTKGINTTSGDAATIDSPIGRFRKDNSGTVFTLTNSQITANSIIILTNATAGTDNVRELTVVAGAGSAVITFYNYVLGVATATAPANDADINFIIMN